MEKEFLENQLDDNKELENSSEEQYIQDIMKLYLEEIGKYPVLTHEELKKYGTALKLY